VKKVKSSFDTNSWNKKGSRMRTAIILAGGKGNRFQKALQKDKLLVEVEGEAVLRKIARVVADLAEELILAVNEESRGRRYGELLSDIAKFKVITDIKPGLNTPLMGFVSGILASKGDYLLVVPGDAAYIRQDELRLLVQKVELEGFECSVPLYEGYIQTLFQALLAEKAKRIAKLLLRYNWRKPDGFIRGSSKIACLSLYPSSSGISPFKTINSPEDVTRSRIASLLLREEIHLHLFDNIRLAEAHFSSEKEALQAYEKLIRTKNFFWAGLVCSTWERLKEFSARAFLMERDFLEKRGLNSLAFHAEKDAKRILGIG